jgi:hypothetical protein
VSILYCLFTERFTEAPFLLKLLLKQEATFFRFTWEKQNSPLSPGKTDIVFSLHRKGPVKNQKSSNVWLPIKITLCHKL